MSDNSKKLWKDSIYLEKQRISRKKRWEDPKSVERYSGQNNPAWNGGSSLIPYNTNLKEKYKEKIRKRDNNICQRCGKNEEENGQKMSTHHFHYDKENPNPELITLCNACDSKANHNRDYWEEYYTRNLAFRGLIVIYSLKEIGIFE